MAHILLVDDEPELRSVYKRLLEDEGHRVDTAINGADALEKLEGLAPDMLLLDVEMPELNGIQLTRRLRASDEARLRAIPVVLLTSHELPEQVQEGLDAGSDGAVVVSPYVVKPVNPDELVEELRLLLTSGEFI